MATVTIFICKDKTVLGNNVSAKFENGRIRRNSRSPETKSIDYIIEYSSTGKIIEDDPLSQNEVEMWLILLNKNIIKAKLRFKEGWAAFPMAGLDFEKLNN